MIRLVVADANAQVLEGLVSALSGDPEIVIDAAVGDSIEIHDAVSRINPNVVVLGADARAVGATDACRRLGHTHPRIRTVIALSSSKQSAMMAALAVGARGVVLKDAGPAILRHAVRTVAEGWSFVDPRLTAKLIEAALRDHQASGIGGLSSLELRLVQRMLLGLDDAEIASKMGMAEAAVRSHVDGLQIKLGAKTRTEAGAIARREGLV